MDESALVGTVLAGKYRVDRIVGDGAMGIVVAAMHLELEERVAIKLLHPEWLDNAEAVARFLREGKAAARIRSDHVARVRDVGRLEGGEPYIVMELLDGMDLGALLAQRGPLSVEVATELVLQACEALVEAHAAGIVHRDLKPSNLFLTQRSDGSPCVKILDFGISKLSHDPADLTQTSTHDVFGSPVYMSPEQLASSADVDARADVWSLAVVFYELLTGKPVFDAPSLPELHAAILKDPTPDVRTVRPDVSAGLARALMAALAKNRDERTASIEAFAAAIASAGDPVEVVVTRASFTSSVRAPARKNMLLRVGVAVLALIGLIGILASAFARVSPPSTVTSPPAAEKAFESAALDPPPPVPELSAPLPSTAVKVGGSTTRAAAPRPAPRARASAAASAASTARALPDDRL